MDSSIAGRLLSSSAESSNTDQSGARKEEPSTNGVEIVPTNETGPLILNEANAVEHTAYMFSTKKKWCILTVVALCQTSMSELPLPIITDFVSMLTRDRLQCGCVFQRDWGSESRVQPWHQSFYQCQGGHGMVPHPLWLRL
ncbi:hypothetical protein NX059_005385 [Plenodomus lindquistii]|nr:hypothetical protein NX059_005385 [Plenodomus lindquistii]